MFFYADGFESIFLVENVQNSVSKHTLSSQRLKEELTIERFHPVVTPESPELILAYDEHVLKNHFKFGLIYQRFGQTMEEQLFSNRGHLSAFEEFLSLMGQRVKLKDHEG